MTEARRITSRFNDELQKVLSKHAKHVCMYPECRRLAINAHAFSKEHSLREIAEGGKVYSPVSIRMDQSAYKDIKFKLLGIQEATTFKGFCPYHDTLFATLDRSGLTTFKDVFLQLYRSFAGELFRYSAYRKSERHAVAESRYFNDEHEKKKAISTAKAVAHFYDLITEFPESSTLLPDGDRLLLTPFSKNASMDSAIVLRRVRFKCQVALHKKYTLHRDGKYFDTFVFVVPSAVGATLLVVCSPDDSDQLLGRVRTDLDTLGFIEACMMHDGQWWLSPSVVEAWSQAKRALIESDYWFFNERAFLAPYDVSLFDQVRLQLCEGVPSTLRNAEIAKIGNLPTRGEPVVRQLKYENKVFEDQQRISRGFQ